MTTFYRNYVSLCASRQKSLSAVAQEIGLSRTSPNGWKKGKVPSAVTLAKLSQYFGVPVEELTSETEKSPLAQSERTLDAATKELYDIWETSDLDERRALIEMARLIKSRRKTP